jgi:hypothetical protein
MVKEKLEMVTASRFGGRQMSYPVAVAVTAAVAVAVGAAAVVVAAAAISGATIRSGWS